MEFQDKLVLEPGDTLRLESSRKKGTLSQEDIGTYSVLDSTGRVKGTVEYRVHTDIKKPHRRTHRVEQRDATCKVLVDETW